MPAVHLDQRFDKIALKWHDLADRRLSYFIELYRSGRWKHYYTPEAFTERMRDVIKAKKAWDRPSLRRSRSCQRNAERRDSSRAAA